jgi:hypothetical protein
MPSTFDSMDSMDSMDSPPWRRGVGAGLDAFAPMVETARLAIANGTRPADAALTPRGVDRAEARLPRPGVPYDAQFHESTVRAELYDFALLSSLRFDGQADNESATLQHRDPDGTLVPLVRIARPALAVFEGQVPYLLDLAQTRTSRMVEVLPQTVPQFAMWVSLANLSAERTPATLELVSCGLRLASSAVQQFKHHLCCPRPLEYSALLQPVIATPGHRSFPSGHATEAFMVARLLALLAGPRCPKGMESQLQAQAARIGQNREVAGVHFPADTLAGRILGNTLGHYLRFVATGEGGDALGTCFDGAAYYLADERLDPTRGREPGASLKYDDAQFSDKAAQATAPAKMQTSCVSLLWARAASEWK